jgi:hypothetical protein
VGWGDTVGRAVVGVRKEKMNGYFILFYYLGSSNWTDMWDPVLVSK